MPLYRDQLLPTESLGPNQYLKSANNRFVFVYERNGELTLYKEYTYQQGYPIWSSGTMGQPAHLCIMQGDGNLVLYGPKGEPLWASGTDQPSSRLIVQNDGNVGIYRPDGTPVWVTNTVQPPPPPTGPMARGNDMQPGEVLTPVNRGITSANGRYTLQYRLDGSLALLENDEAFPDQPHRLLWTSGTSGRPIQVCILQDDGNLVIYGPDGEYIWDSGTSNNPGSRLVVHDDGDVAIYRPDNTQIWTTGTGPPPPPPPPTGWGFDDNGELRDQDVDVIRFQVDHHAVGADEVEFVLDSVGEKWKKWLILDDGLGGRWAVETDGRTTEARNGLYPYQLPNGTLEFWKAKSLGRMTKVLDIPIASLQAEDRVTFYWERD